MAITGDFTSVANMDSGQGGLVSDGTAVQIGNGPNSTFKVQGTDSQVGQFKAAATGGAGYQYGTAQDWRQRHVMGWINNLDVADLAVNGGWRMRLESVGNDGSWGSDYGDWYCGGRDTLNVFLDRFLFLCADVQRPYDASAGTAARNSSRTLGVVINATSGSGQNTWFQDELKYGTGLTVPDGTSGTPLTSADIVSADRSAGWGVFLNANGPYLLTGGLTIGNSGTASSYFVDSNETWTYSNLPVANHFHHLTLQGNSTGTNEITFGTLSGTGTSEAGSGGNVFSAGGEVPFQIVATDSDVDEGGFYGCTFLGPVALRGDPWRNVLREDNSATSYTDITDDVNDINRAAQNAFPAGAGANDAIYFGSEMTTNEITVNTSTAGAGTYTVTWEYGDGTTWKALTDVTDGTNGFKTAGNQTVTFQMPDDMAAQTVNSLTRFWIRARRDGGTVTTNPQVDESKVFQGGRIQLETSAMKAVSCTITNMETIRVRGGAFLKKCTISDSVANAKACAVDLGSEDPAQDTVRDLTISGAAGGILVKDYQRFLDAGAAVDKGGGLVGIPSTGHGWSGGKSITLTGTTNYDGTYTLDNTTSANELVIPATYVAETFATTDTASPNETFNLRSIAFASNTNDVRVDYPAQSTVTINILENGDTPTIDNVNTSTVNVVNAVEVRATSRDAVTLQPIQNVRVRLEADQGGDLPAGASISITRSGTTATVTHTSHGFSTGDQVVIRGANELPYNGIKTITVTGVNTYTFTVTGSPATPATDGKLAHAQDETSYDNTPTTEGTFTGGTGYAVNDTITLSNSGQVTVDAVSAGVVTQFTVNGIPALAGGYAGEVLTQRSTTGGGSGFTLTLDTDNLTIQSSAMILNALSNSSGVVEDTGFDYTNPQPVRGSARKATVSPLYKPSLLVGTIGSTGLELNPYLISDE